MWVAGSYIKHSCFGLYKSAKLIYHFKIKPAAPDTCPVRFLRSINIRINIRILEQLQLVAYGGAIRPNTLTRL